MKLVVEFDSNSESAISMSDSLWLGWFTGIVHMLKLYGEDGGEYKVCIGSEAAITTMRVLIARGVMSKNDCKVVFEGKELSWDTGKKPNFTNWPTGFCDTTFRLIMELL